MIQFRGVEFRCYFCVLNCFLVLQSFVSNESVVVFWWCIGIVRFLS